MSACFLAAAAEILRLTTPQNVPGTAPAPVLNVWLLDDDPELNRARSAPRYGVTLALSWGPPAWRAGVVLVDLRGYPVSWTFQELGQWFARSLSAARCAVIVEIVNAATVPAPWTPARMAASGARVQALDAQALTSQANAKNISVSAWVPSARKTAVMDAAARMIQAAALLDQAKAVQAGAAFE